MNGPSTPLSDDGMAGVRALVRRARDRVREECANGPVGTPEPSLLLEEIGRVADLVEAHLVSAPPPRLPAPGADRKGILDALRARMLEDWRNGDTPELLRAMRAIEAARGSVEDGGSGPLAPGILTPYGHRLLREVAHTLRSPMGSMVMLAGTLHDGGSGAVNDLQRKHLGIIHRAAMSLANMAGDLLSLTGEEDGLVGDAVPLRVDEILREVAQVVGPVAEERGLAFSARTEEEAVRLGRPRPLGRALTNLALNSALLARDGTLELDARREDGDTIRFTVAVDSAREDAAELFRVFSAPGAEDEYTLSRSGLGLSMARHLIHRMGSELDAECSPDRAGLRFGFSLRLPTHV